MKGSYFALGVMTAAFLVLLCDDLRKRDRIKEHDDICDACCKAYEKDKEEAIQRGIEEWVSEHNKKRGETETVEEFEAEKAVEEAPIKLRDVNADFINSRVILFDTRDKAIKFIEWWNDKLNAKGRVVDQDIIEEVHIDILEHPAVYYNVPLDENTHLFFATSFGCYEIILPPAHFKDMQ